MATLLLVSEACTRANVTHGSLDVLALLTKSTAWKDYFIRHVEQLGPRIYPQAYAQIRGQASSPRALSNSLK